MNDILERMIQYMHYIAGLIITLTAVFLGGYDTALQLLVTMVVIDYITGVLSAFAMQMIDSDISRKGVARKVGIFLAVAIAQIIDERLGAGGSVRLIIISFYIGTEGKSALENLAQAGVPIPPKLRAALKQLNNDNQDT